MNLETTAFVSNKAARASLISFACFALVTLVMASGWLTRFDESLLLAFRTEDLARPIGGRVLLQGMRDLSALGGTLVLCLTSIAAAAVLVHLGRRRLAALVIGSNILAQVCSWALKHAILRPRPEIVPHLVEAFGASYPSGHSLMSAAIWLTLGGLAAQHAAPARRWLVWGVFALLVGAIGVSRVYLGVHWPSDVLAGWAFGAFWAFGALALARKLHQI